MATSRREAIAHGLTHYETGLPCKRGHVTKRFASNGSCVSCSTEDGRRFASAHPYEPAKARAAYLKVNHRPAKPCVRCGSEIPAGAHANRDHCSPACKRAGDTERVVANHIQRYRSDARYREMFQRNGHVRRARMRAAPFVRFDPVTILERDGWSCQVCGCETPRELRGQKVSNAPTLDHVVPIALGGPHTPENTRCACHRCNMSLGARVRRVA